MRNHVARTGRASARRCSAVCALFPTVFALLFLYGCAAVGSALDPVPDEPARPSAELEPEEVVRIQLEAFAAADGEDLDGELLYSFASPDFRAAFDGPEEFADHFTRRPYGALVGHREARYRPLELEGRFARQEVTVVTDEGEERRYGFLLLEQTGGDCDGCWLVESVRAFLD